MVYPSYAEIDLSALEHNYNAIKEAAGGTRVLCVVKADAYGHGAVECAKKLYSLGADAFAVACLAEAEEIRPYVGDSLILILGAVCPEDAPELCEYNITQNVYSLDFAKQLSANVPEGKTLHCHIKLDTGMNRLGFRADESSVDDIAEACGLPGLCCDGIFTHFARADEDTPVYAEEQFRRYMNTLKLLENRGITFSIRHVSNSAGIVNFPSMRLDMVRAGIILYGLEASGYARLKDGIPVMSLYTHVTHVHTLKKGESVSYGGTFTADHDMKVATMCIGYADGFVRGYSGANLGRSLEVYINGRPAVILGRICMDQCICDVDKIDCKPGDIVTVFDKENTCDRLAYAAGTINYEVTSILTRRVKRIYR